VHTRLVFPIIMWAVVTDVVACMVSLSVGLSATIVGLGWAQGTVY